MQPLTTVPTPEKVWGFSQCFFSLNWFS